VNIEVALKGIADIIEMDSTPYHYSPLNVEAQEIRLLTLLPATPGEPSSKIRLVLDATPFTNDNAPNFEALSYAWGSTEHPVDIFVGPSENHTLEVTRNLAEALAYLRFKDRPRVLWIDAICVNQQDLEERSQQVQRMADIFSKAARVLIWLGLETPDTSIAIKCIEQISSNVDVDWDRWSIRPTSTQTHWADMNLGLPFDEVQILAIELFFQRSWFGRLWVWQELRMAWQDPVVLCGARELLWESICDYAYCMIMKNNSHISDHFWERISLLYQLCNKAYKTWPEGFDTLIRRTQNCQCSDPRDKIFALLSMIGGRDAGFRLTPDYSKSVIDVYIDTAIRYTEFRGDLKLLSTVEFHSQELPSWIPNWKIPRRTDSLAGDYLASGYSTARVKFCEGKAMQVTGCFFTTIKSVEVFHPLWRKGHRDSDESFVENIRRMATSIELEVPFTHENEKFEAFCRTLSSNRFCESYSPQETRFPTLQQVEATISKALDARFSPVEVQRSIASDVDVVAAVSGEYRNRSFFKTTGGQIGIGLYAMMAGDVVAVLLGCRTPIILRPYENHTYQVIGEAYCHGVMTAEVLLGPLPSPFDFVSRLGYSAFMNRDTGSSQPEDPRLGHLPLPPSVSTPKSPRHSSTSRVALTDLWLYSGGESAIQRKITTIFL
jgi:hypothetical protein